VQGEETHERAEARKEPHGDDKRDGGGLADGQARQQAAADDGADDGAEACGLRDGGGGHRCAAARAGIDGKAEMGEGGAFLPRDGKEGKRCGGKAAQPLLHGQAVQGGGDLIGAQGSGMARQVPEAKAHEADDKAKPQGGHAP